MDTHRKLWNERHAALRLALKRRDHAQAVALFLEQHAMLHTAEMAPTGAWSFEDEVWQGLDEAGARRIPAGLEHSIAWALWHITRIEDITTNLLLAGQPQLLLDEGWYERLKVSARDTGNGMRPAEIAGLSAALDLAALRAYRLAVGRQTQAVVQRLEPADFQRPIDPARLQQARQEGAVIETEGWLLDYWGGHTGGSLLLMPPTRHSFVHLNEALKIKRKLKASTRSRG